MLVCAPFPRGALPEETSSPSRRRRPYAWAGALLAVALAVMASAEARGRDARKLFEPGADTGPDRIAMVNDAAGAYRVWREAGLRGRHLVVLTGQWSRPRNLKTHPPTPEEMAAAQASGDMELLDAQGALYSAGRVGMVRRFDVVMPPAAFSQRLGQVRGQKELQRGDGAFVLPYQGLERRFSTPRAFAVPGETVLLLVEPSWFGAGVPSDPLGWLAGLGLRWDLALIALDDPVAQGEERQAALTLGQTAGARFWEVAP